METRGRCSLRCTKSIADWGKWYFCVSCLLRWQNMYPCRGLGNAQLLVWHQCIIESSNTWETTSQYQKMTRHYPNLVRDTCFVTGIDKKRREIPLALIYNALGATKAASLPGFHPLSGETSLNDLPARENWLFGKCWKNLTQTMTKYRHFYSFIIWSSHCCH